MTSLPLNLVVRRASSSLVHASARVQKRGMHASSVVMKKSKADALFIDSMPWFKPEDAHGSDSVVDIPSPSQSAVTHARADRFNTALLNFRKTLGKDRLNPPRRSTWATLFQLAENKENLESVVGLIPLWNATPAARRIMDGKLGHETADLFIRRCTQLNAVPLALNVLGSCAKYGVSLTLPSARLLLNTMRSSNPIPIDQLTILASLYSVHNLPPITSDLPSLALLTSALSQSNSEGRRAAKELLPQLRLLLKKEGLVKVPIGKVGRESEEEEWKVWMKWAIASIDNASRDREGRRKEWLVKWRAACGHVQEEPVHIVMV